MRGLSGFRFFSRSSCGDVCADASSAWRQTPKTGASPFTGPSLRGTPWGPTLVALVFALCALLLSPPRVAAACAFVAGFRALASRIPDVVGDCLDDERHDPLTGETQQRTTRGLLVWRQIDNHTAFTDGARTWILTPWGVAVRGNTERFPWEQEAALAPWLQRAERDGRPVWALLIAAQRESVARTGTPMALPWIPPGIWAAWAREANRPVVDILLEAFFADAPWDGVLERAALDEVNRHRAAHGLPPVRLNRYAVLAARAHAVYDVVHGKRHGHHEVPGTLGFVGEWPSERARFFGAREAYLGENLHGITGPAAVIQGFMDSPPHRENVLMVENPALGPLMMGYAEAVAGPYRSAAMTIGSMP